MSRTRKILVPVDFSADSGKALELAIAFARETGAELHVAHAFSLPLPLLLPYEFVMPDVVRDQARETVRGELEKEAEIARAQGVPTAAHLLETPAAAAIAALAESLGIDLIVMGTVGRSGLAHVVLGSVAERVLRIAPCAVMTVKRGPD